MHTSGIITAKSALSVMKSMAAWQEQQAEDKTGTAGLPWPAPQEPAKTAEASEEFYFGTQMTISKLMYFIVDAMVGYLNEKLGVGRDGDPKSVGAGQAWRDEALLETTPINSDKDFSIPEPGRDGVSFSDVARSIMSKFKMGYLKLDTNLINLLEELIGFRLDGVSPADIVQAIVDPDSKDAQRVREALEEGLAGQEGSKVSQRLERIAEGPKSVSEILSEKKSPADVVDEETLEEEREALKVARAHEKLTEIRDTQEAIAEAVREREPADGRADPEDARRAVDAAMAVIQQLNGAAGDDNAADEAVVESEEDATQAAAPDAAGETGQTAEELVETLEAQEAELEDENRSFAALAEAYRDDLADWRERDDEDRQVRFRI